jgi:hypothetical protein
MADGLSPRRNRSIARRRSHSSFFATRGPSLRRHHNARRKHSRTNDAFHPLLPNVLAHNRVPDVSARSTHLQLPSSSNRANATSVASISNSSIPSRRSPRIHTSARSNGPSKAPSARAVTAATAHWSPEAEASATQTTPSRAICCSQRASSRILGESRAGVTSRPCFPFSSYPCRREQALPPPHE